METLEPEIVGELESSINDVENINNKDTGIENYEPTKHDLIALEYLLLGHNNQTQLAEKYGLTQGTVSWIVKKYQNNDALQKRINRFWDKKTSAIARTKALKIIEGIRPNKIVEQQKATSAAILIDKARLLDGESDKATPNTAIQINIVNYHE